MSEANQGVPTKEEIAKLPLKAQVAFAARCARRAFPVAKAFWDTDLLLGPIERTISRSERVGGGETVAAFITDNRADDLDLVSATTTAAFSSSAAAAAAATAAIAAAKAARAFDTFDAFDAVRAAADATGNIELIRSDYDLLLRAATERRWTDNTPVPTDFFPPLEAHRTSEGEDEGALTADKIRLLPRWARVAFAARCARRVLSLFRKGWPDAPDEDNLAINKAVETAEAFAASAAYDFATAYTAANAAYAAATATDHYSKVNASTAVGTAAIAAYAAATAAFAATNAEAGDAVVGNVDATADYAAKADVGSIELIRSDFDLLLRAVTERQWTDNTPVPPDFFPPITDTDEAIQPAEDPDPGPPLSLLFEVGTLTPFEMQHVIGLVGEMYHGLTGDELIIDSTDSFDPVASLVPQGGLS